MMNKYSSHTLMGDFKTIFVSILLIFAWSANVRSADGDSLQQAIQRGELFLKTEMLQNQFGILCQSNSLQRPCPVSGTGKIFASYFVLDALGDNIPENIKKNMVAIIKAEEKNHIWGYSLNSPPDADDTSFALQILTKLGEKQNIDGLLIFYKPYFRAYSTFLAIQEKNFGIHPDVNANIFHFYHLLNLDAVINYDLISASQNKQGDWQSYYYAGKYYSTYLNMKILCETKQRKVNVLQGLHFLKSTQNNDGSWSHDPYDTALALNALLVCERQPSVAVTSGVKALLKMQTKNGDWVRDKMIFSYVYQEKPRIVWSFYDNTHLVTTALATLALKRYADASLAPHTG